MKGFYITPNLDRSPNVRANEAIIANHAPHAILRFFEILIFLEFYKCEKYEIRLQRMRMQVLLIVVTMDCIEQVSQ